MYLIIEDITKKPAANNLERQCGDEFINIHIELIFLFVLDRAGNQGDCLDPGVGVCNCGWKKSERVGSAEVRIEETT